VSFINLLVLRCNDVAKTRAFYECFGLEFDQHRHGDGPPHLGTMDGMGLILELYPASEKNPADRTGLGLGAPNLEKIIAALRAKGFEPGSIEARPWGMTFIVRDPDGRRVEVKHELSEGDPEFEEELQKRIDAHERGDEQGIPYGEVMKEFREDLSWAESKSEEC
jgi:catechol 2,3-dioxygenase-like lactoylglutathione lyase family enzyme